jgi:cytochrome P450
VTINVYGCNMNKQEWEEPEEWRPERFLDGRFDSADMFKTLSFGAGKRVCAGSVQAINISCAAIARLVQEFAWRLKKGDKDEDVSDCSSMIADFVAKRSTATICYRGAERQGEEAEAVGSPAGKLVACIIAEANLDDGRGRG